jgi:hypothetical protein
MDTSDFSMLRSQLKQGERLLWSGYPRRGIHLRFSQRLAIIVLPIVAAALALLTFVTILIAKNGPHGALFIIAIFWFSALSVGFEKVIDALRRRNMFYGLTQYRAIIVEGLFEQRIRSIQLATLTEITLNERADQTGTIRGKSLPDQWFRKNNRGEEKPLPLFKLIVDARHVHDLILDLRRCHEVQGDKEVWANQPALPDTGA